MRLFTIMIYVFAAIAVLTGISDLAQGLVSQKSLGAGLTDAGFADPLVDNVFRFFAAIWIGVGVLFVLFIRDLDRYKPAMIALLSIVVLGGGGRILSILQYGLPESSAGIGLISVGLLAEVVASPIILWWLIARHRSAYQPQEIK